MKILFRILSYARPWGRYAIPYTTFSLLSSVFGVFNFTLIQPLLDVLFEKATPSQAQALLVRPEFIFDVSYIIQLFNYYFGLAMQQNGKMGALWYVCGIIVVSVLLSNVCRYLAVRVLENVKSTTVARVRQAIFDKTVSLNLGFFTNERKGDLMARLTTDVQEIENTVGKAFVAAFKEPFSIVIFFTTLFLMSPKLTMFSLIIIPISGTLIASLTKRLKVKAREVQARLGNVVSLLDETLGGIRVIKGFNAENFITKRFEVENLGYRKAYLSMVYRQETVSPFSEVSGVVMASVILLYGGSLVLSEPSQLSASTFLTYLIVFSQVLRPVKELSNAFSNIQRGLAAGERIFQVIDTQAQVLDLPQAPSIKDFQEKIEFKNIYFSYLPSVAVLKNVNFTLQKGKTVALVGASGSGKSTIADLLPRFYDTTAGQILLDDIDIKDVNATSLRNLMGIVTQESILFNDTIFNNIAFGIAATQEQVIAAAKIANAHQFIIESPNGYQTSIGDRGSKLSGGQRQRISIARAVLKNPPILILDEATSALDTESEKLVQEALTYLMKNRTTLVIAHRLSTIQYADEILVMNQGEIIERGTHEILLAKNGFYTRLNNMQQL